MRFISLCLRKNIQFPKPISADLTSQAYNSYTKKRKKINFKGKASIAITGKVKATY